MGRQSKTQKHTRSFCDDNRELTRYQSKKQAYKYDGGKSGLKKFKKRKKMKPDPYHHQYPEQEYLNFIAPAVDYVKCFYCRRHIDRKLAIKHHLDKRKNIKHNVVLCCLKCNDEKGDLSASVYLSFRIQRWQDSLAQRPSIVMGLLLKPSYPWHVKFWKFVKRECQIFSDMYSKNNY